MQEELDRWLEMKDMEIRELATKKREVRTILFYTSRYNPIFIRWQMIPIRYKGDYVPFYTVLPWCPGWGVHPLFGLQISPWDSFHTLLEMFETKKQNKTNKNKQRSSTGNQDASQQP